MVADSGLVTITGGKWTTYRKMAEDTMDQAITIGKLAAKPCVTANLKIHGYAKPQATADYLHVYGSDAAGIKALIHKRPELNQKLISSFPNTKAEVVWAVKHEMARTIEDVLARRMRVLFLNAKAAIDMAPAVATIMAAELGLSDAWKQNQVSSFIELANQYLLTTYTPIFDKEVSTSQVA